MINQQHTDSENHMPITWQTSIPLLSSAVIIKQLFLVFFISSACVLIFLLKLAWIEGQLTLAIAGNYLLVVALILAGLLLLSVLSMLVIYGNRYEVQFTLNEIGVQSKTVGKTRQYNAIINALLVLSGRPGPSGAGLMAASRQSELIKWKSLGHYKANPDKLEIQLFQGKRTIILVQCTTDNYVAVLKSVQQSIPSQSLKITT